MFPDTRSVTDPPTEAEGPDAEPQTTLVQAPLLAEQTRDAFLTEIAGSGLTLDPAQREAVAALRRPTVQGWYLWGGVGRGKTMLADAYFRSIPTSAKRRVHFHAFFRELHAQIIAGRRPIEETIAEMLAGDRAVLFDEFHVHDVADAVYLARTFEVILELDILVIATSNYAPAGLLPDPMFHDRFLPTIALIEQHLSVVEVGQGPDHRSVDVAPRTGGFARSTWTVRGGGPDAGEAEVRDGAPTFSFAALCEAPKGAWDYLELAERHPRIVVSGIPELHRLDPQSAARFCVLIDILADADITVDCIASGHWRELGDVAEPPADLPRTISRLSRFSLGA